jgi:hypothetical protein
MRTLTPFRHKRAHAKHNHRGRILSVMVLCLTLVATQSTTQLAVADPLPSTPSLTNQGVIFEADNSITGPDGNTQLTAGNQNLTSLPQGNKTTVRMQVNNTGGALSDTTKLSLFYNRGDGQWSKVQSNPSVATGAGNCASGIMNCSVLGNTARLPSTTTARHWLRTSTKLTVVCVLLDMWARAEPVARQPCGRVPPSTQQE